jgi:predicted nucleotidyltransferase component of viral defense system
VIPADFIAEWRAHARWPTDEQVEQDLVLCRALVEIFEDAELAAAVSLRGGTALHKLHFSPAQRYSEDIRLSNASANFGDGVQPRKTRSRCHAIAPDAGRSATSSGKAMA